MNNYFSTNMFNNIHESCAVLDKIKRIMSTKGYSYVFKHVMTFTSLIINGGTIFPPCLRATKEIIAYNFFSMYFWFTVHYIAIM